MDNNKVNKVNIIEDAKGNDYVHDNYCMTCGIFTKCCSGTGCCKGCDNIQINV